MVSIPICILHSLKGLRNMKLEEEIFQKCIFNIHKLQKYGFTEKESSYTASFSFLDGQFIAHLVFTNGHMEARCLDACTMEDYIPIRRSGVLGEYASKVKEEYTAILLQCKKACSIPQTFHLPQSNRLVSYVQSSFGESVHFLFKNDTDTGVFLNEKNQKWYGIIQYIDGTKLGLEEGKKEILNVKTDEVSSLLQKEGFYPAFHMSKQHWVSVILDDTVDDETLHSLIHTSRAFTAGKRGKQEVHSWLIPSNPKYFDIVGALETRNTIHWNRHANIQPMDTVYLYVGKPYSSIMYRFTVLSIDEEREIMELQLQQSYPQDLCTLAKMRAEGVNTPRGARYMPECLMRLLLQ